MKKFILITTLIASFSVSATCDFPKGSALERQCIKATDWELQDCIKETMEEAANDPEAYEVDESEAAEFCQNLERSETPIRAFNPSTGEAYFPAYTK